MIPEAGPGRAGRAKIERRDVDGVLLLDKPLHVSSNGALGRAKYLFQAKKAGHTGTLDPLATGLLPVCFGEATKFSADLLDADKSYRAVVRLGVTTETGDSEGRILRERPVAVDEATARQGLGRFLGVIEQIPPMYSALKRDGRPLYEYARRGETLEREARRVTIHALSLVQYSSHELVIDVTCSKGTYVRTLAEDLGESLGCGAHLVALRRTAVGRFRVEDAIDLAALEALPAKARMALLDPVDVLCESLPRAELTPDLAMRFQQGQKIGGDWGGAPGERMRVYDSSADRFLGIAVVGERGQLLPQRLVGASFAGSTSSHGAPHDKIKGFAGF